MPAHKKQDLELLPCRRPCATRHMPTFRSGPSTPLRIPLQAGLIYKAPEREKNEFVSANKLFGDSVVQRAPIHGNFGRA